MALTIMGFGKIAEILGTSCTTDDVADTDALKLSLEAQFPELKGISYLVAIDKKMVRTNTPLHTGSIIALLPPFSGG